MLDVMRRHAQSWVIKGIFIIIIIVFILFWAEPREKGTALQTVAVVNGSKITLSQYRRSYENLLSLYRSIYRDSLSDEMIRTMKLKEKALDNLIDNIILLEEADKLGLIVSDAELIDSISKYPAFQKDNAFDKAQYMAVLKANRLTPDEFEEEQSKNILVSKVEGLVKEGVKISDDEVWDIYARQRGRVNVELVKVDPKDFLKDVKVSEDEAKDYFSKNKEALLKAADKKELKKVPEYEDVKEKVLAAAAGKKAEGMAFKKGEELLEGLRDGKLNMSKLPYKPLETGLFGRGGVVPKAGVSEEMNNAAFMLTKEAPYPPKPFAIQGVTYVIKLKERLDAGREGLKTEEAPIREQLKQQKGEEVLKNWSKIARTKAKIKRYEEFLQ